MFDLKPLRSYLKSKCLANSTLGDIQYTMVKEKHLINEILNLNDDNNYRAAIPLVLTESEFNAKYLKTVNVIKRVLIDNIGPITKLSFLDNYYKIKDDKNKPKLSRALNKYIDKIMELRDERVVNDIEKDISYKITKQNFVTSFFSLTKMGNIYITTNINEMIINSNESWDNCYNPGGCHFSASTAHVNDPFTILVYKLRNRLDNPYEITDKRYAGRCWMHLLPKKGFVLANRSYGDLPGQYIDEAFKYIRNRMNNYYNLKDSCWEKNKKHSYSNYMYPEAEDETYGHTSRSVYFDGAYNTVNILNNSSAVNYEAEPCLDFGKSICLLCGNEFNQGNSTGLCRNCRNESFSYCSDCSISYTSEMRTTVHYYKNDVPSIKYMCPSCAEDKTISCVECNRLYVDTEMIVYNGNTYCPGCYKQTFKECKYCGDIHEMNDALRYYNKKSGELICNKCESKALEDKLIQPCKFCSELTLVSNLTDNSYCRDCYINNCYTCVTCKAVHPLIHMYELREKNKNKVITVKYICNTCYTDNEVKCEFCGSLTKNISTTLSNGVHKIICDSCKEYGLVICNSCNGTFYNELYYSKLPKGSENDHITCPQCIRKIIEAEDNSSKIKRIFDLRKQNINLLKACR